MNSTELKTVLLARVNAEVGIPFLGEDQEAALLMMVVGPLVDQLPVKLLPFFIDATDGISSADLDKHCADLADFTNDLVDIPYVTESIEGRLIEMIIKSALTPLLKGSKV